MSSVDENIELARELVEILLENEKNNDNPNKKVKLSQKHLAMLSVSKFIAIKEHILKKDDKTIFFDNVKDSDFIDKIISIYDKLNLPSSEVDGKRFYCNSTFVDLKNPTTAPAKLKDALLLFNKIRDSIAHGKYDIAADNNSIIINNDGSNLDYPNDYCLKCSIPIELLNEITFFDNTTSLDSKIAKDFDDIFVVEKPFIIKYRVTDNLTKYKGGKISKFKLSKNQDFSKKIEKLLSFNEKNDQKEMIVKLAKEYEEILNNKDKYQDYNKMNFELKRVFIDLYRALEIDKNMPRKELVAALYNYMTLVFSQEKDVDYSILPIQNIKFVLNPAKFNEDDKKLSAYRGKEVAIDKAINYESELKRIAVGINSECNDFIKFFNKLIIDYPRYSNDSFVSTGLRSFVDFYYNVLSKIILYNRTYYKNIIKSSMRNSVLHSNILSAGGEIIALYDLSMHNYDESINFVCEGKVEDLFKLTKAVSKAPVTNINTPCAGSPNFTDIKNMIENEKYNQIVNIIKTYAKEFLGRDIGDNYSFDDAYKDSIEHFNSLNASHNI